MKQLLIKNPHRLVLTMSPDDEYVEKQTRLEAKLLESKIQTLTEEQKELVSINSCTLCIFEIKNEVL